MSAVPMCPGCRAILDPGQGVCPYCGWNVEQTETRREGGAVERALRPLGGPVPVLLAANLLLYAATAVVDARTGRGLAAGGSFADAVMGGLMHPRSLTLLRLGANAPERVLDGEVWRILCPLFLHGGLLHIVVNMMSLRSIGGPVVEAYGAGKALALYLLTGIAGSLGSIAWYLLAGRIGVEGVSGQIPRIGASGAIFGYVGILAALGFRIGGPAGKALWKPMIQSAGFIFVLGLVLSFTGGPILLDNSAHVGGLLSGLAFGWLTPFGIRSRGNLAAVKAWDAAAVVLSLLVVASFGPPALALLNVR